MEDIIITISYVNKLLCNLHSHKTTCPKGVPSWLLKEIAEVAPAVTLIVQASLDLCCIPFSWKRHWSSRYFRKGNRSAESSNRPPSPPSSVRCVNTSSTVLTLVISLNSQHGFCKRSCDTQFIRTIHDLVSGSEEKEHTDPILFDSEKAFDNLKVTSCLLQHQIEHMCQMSHSSLG